MPRSVRILLIFIISFLPQNLFSQDTYITEKNVNAFYRFEYTRGSEIINEISSIGFIELAQTISFRAGFSAGRSFVDTEINTLVNLNYSPFEKLPLFFSLSWIYNGYPEYENHTHSLFPFASFNTKYFGTTLGVNLQFSSFFEEKSYLESYLSLYIYCNIVNNDFFRIGFSTGNFNEFNLKNLGAYFFNINSSVRINNGWYLLGDIEFLHSGTNGLSSTFLGISTSIGVKFSW